MPRLANAGNDYSTAGLGDMGVAGETSQDGSREAMMKRYEMLRRLFSPNPNSYAPMDMGGGGTGMAGGLASGLSSGMQIGGMLGRK